MKEGWADNLSMDPTIIDYNATEENIMMIFDYLKNIVTKNDLLYVVVINHGNDNHHINFWKIKIYIDYWQGIFAHDTYFVLEKIEKVSNKELNNEDNLGFYHKANKIDNKIYDYELNDYTKNIVARRIIFVLAGNACKGAIRLTANQTRSATQATSAAVTLDLPCIRLSVTPIQ